MGNSHTIARNLCIDYFRRKPECELNKDIPVPPIEKNYIDEALDKLDEDERELLFLRYTNEESINDTAKQDFYSKLMKTKKY